MIVEMYVIYQHAADYPGQIVARQWVLGETKYIPSGCVLTGETLDDVRKQMPRGMICIGRAQHDDPVIREVWL